MFLQPADRCVHHGLHAFVKSVQRKVIKRLVVALVSKPTSGQDILEPASIRAKPFSSVFILFAWKCLLFWGLVHLLTYHNPQTDTTQYIVRCFIVIIYWITWAFSVELKILKNYPRWDKKLFHDRVKRGSNVKLVKPCAGRQWPAHQLPVSTLCFLQRMSHLISH